MATMAMGRLNSLQMQYNSPGGIPVFLTRFRDAIQDLKDANNPISDVMAKSLLLSKVQDRSNSHIVDALMVSNDNCDECMQRLLDKHNMLNQGKGPGPLGMLTAPTPRAGTTTGTRTTKATKAAIPMWQIRTTTMLRTMAMVRVPEFLLMFGTSGLGSREC